MYIILYLYMCVYFGPEAFIYEIKMNEVELNLYEYRQLHHFWISLKKAKKQ
jgi:hypothetical protein